MQCVLLQLNTSVDLTIIQKLLKTQGILAICGREIKDDNGIFRHNEMETDMVITMMRWLELL